MPTKIIKTITAASAEPKKSGKILFEDGSRAFYWINQEFSAPLEVGAEAEFVGEPKDGSFLMTQWGAPVAKGRGGRPGGGGGYTPKSPAEIHGPNVASIIVECIRGGEDESVAAGWIGLYYKHVQGQAVTAPRPAPVATTPKPEPETPAVIGYLPFMKRIKATTPDIERFEVIAHKQGIAPPVLCARCQAAGATDVETLLTIAEKMPVPA